MAFDYHSHTTRCRHATGTMEEYIERALALGMAEFGFSDHSPWMPRDEPPQRSAMEERELPEYVADVLRLRERYESSGARPFRLRLGLEMDFIPSRIELAREMIAPYPWDYLIGSVHHLGLWCLPKRATAHLYDRYDFEEVCELYFYQIRRMIESRFCDVIAHLDVIKRYGHQPRGGMLRHIEPLIPLMKANQIAVEVNTSGCDYPCEEVFPGWEVIEALHAAGVPLMVSSDAHTPEHVGRHFTPTLQKLRALGVRELAAWEKREMRLRPLRECMSENRTGAAPEGKS